VKEKINENDTSSKFNNSYYWNSTNLKCKVEVVSVHAMKVRGVTRGVTPLILNFGNRSV